MLIASDLHISFCTSQICTQIAVHSILLIYIGLDVLYMRQRRGLMCEKTDVSRIIVLFTGSPARSSK